MQVAAFHSQEQREIPKWVEEEEKSPKRKVSRSLRSREKRRYNGVWYGSGRGKCH